MKKLELTEAAREARRRASREWDKAHPERRREIMRRYWERRGQKLLAEQAVQGEEAKKDDRK